MNRKAVPILAVLFTILLVFSAQQAECKKFNIVVLNEDLEMINEVYEGETFLIYVSDASDPSQPLDNYTVIFNGNEYMFDRSDPNYPFCYLTAPQVNQDQIFQIVIKKDGYDDGKVTITVKNRAKLLVYPSTFSVESGQKLTLYVKDEHGISVSGAFVSLEIGSKSYTAKTDDSGMVTFTIPTVKVKTTAYVDVSKSGFESVRIEGTVTPHAPSGFPVDPNVMKIAAIVIMVIFVVAGSIRYVQGRERLYEGSHSLFKGKTREISIEPERTAPRGGMKMEESMKIEEIVINKPEEDRGNFKKTGKTSAIFGSARRGEKGADTWIAGSKSIIKKIDEKLERAEDKKDAIEWLSAKEDIAAKVDEKLKEIERKRRSNPP